jgi:acetoin utilization protein AcuB
MLSNQFIDTHYPTVEPDDKVQRVLHLMDDFDIMHLPVVNDDVFIGMISKDDLLDAEEDAQLQVLHAAFVNKSIKADEHILAAVALASEFGFSIVPVISPEKVWVGAISMQNLLKGITLFTGAEEKGAVIVLEMERHNYSFGEITRLVETNDAYITQFNTQIEQPSGLLVLTIKVNKVEVSDIIATFQRYDYTIRYFIGEEHYENELRSNYDNLMSYLKV